MSKKTTKLPWMKFFPGDWSTDPALTLCAPATRGIWIDLICAMHELDQSGKLRGTVDQLARFARCTTVEFVHAMTDLQGNRAADVAERNGVYEICNRRMAAAYKSRKSIADRVQRHRSKKRNGVCNAGETDHISEVRGQNSSSTSKQGSIPVGPLPQNWATTAAGLRKEGVRKADDACRDAIDHGCSPEDVLAVLCHFRGKPGCWDAQDLYYRVIDLKPGDDFTQHWRTQKLVAETAYRAVTAEEFREFGLMKKFKTKPSVHATNPNWVFGTLRDGTKVECRDYPTKAKANP